MDAELLMALLLFTQTVCDPASPRPPPPSVVARRDCSLMGFLVVVVGRVCRSSAALHQGRTVFLWSQPSRMGIVWNGSVCCWHIGNRERPTKTPPVHKQQNQALSNLGAACACNPHHHTDRQAPAAENPTKQASHKQGDGIYIARLLQQTWEKSVVSDTHRHSHTAPEARFYDAAQTAATSCPPPHLPRTMHISQQPSL